MSLRPGITDDRRLLTVKSPRLATSVVASDRQLSPMPERAAEPVGRFHAWWRGDPLPLLPRWPELTMQLADAELVGSLAGIGLGEAVERERRGHQPWLARLSGEPVGWGWCAAAEASIGELGITRPIPPGNRYLWDFWTVPAWRGHGIYPRLLQAIVTHEREANRYWLGHDLGNVASARGIAKAGFQEVGLLYRHPDGGWELVPNEPVARAVAASDLFGVLLANRLSARTA